MDASCQMKSLNSHGTMDESDSFSYSISSSASSEDIEGSVSSSSSDSSSSSSSEGDGPLYEVNSLRANLPFKRGLSKFYGGKSQSFSSLADVKCLDDLAKPDNPYRKKMKSSHSYGAQIGVPRSYPPQSSSGSISKKPQNGNFASLKKDIFLPNRPPVSPLKNLKRGKRRASISRENEGKIRDGRPFLFEQDQDLSSFLKFVDVKR